MAWQDYMTPSCLNRVQVKAYSRPSAAEKQVTLQVNCLNTLTAVEVPKELDFLNTVQE